MSKPTCNTCKGSGRVPFDCPTCDGAGAESRTGVRRVCSTCLGSKIYGTTGCYTCGGSGLPR